MSKFQNTLYGAVEAGGTKFVCAVGAGGDELLTETAFPTTTPEETLARVADFFADARARHGAVADATTSNIAAAARTNGMLTSEQNGLLM
ncbi:MAG: ROK family protein, partial [Rudaea sp.]|nr:ROK family protein [Rudaea sp.]